MAQTESLAEKLAKLRAQKEKGTSTEVSLSTPPVEELPKEETKVEEKEIDINKLPLLERLAYLKKSAGSSSSVPSSSSTSVVKKEEKKLDLKSMGEAIRKMPELPQELHEKAPSETHALRARIWRLQESSDGINLKDEMKKLQEALLENPTAVSYFLPEDYGEMVHHIRTLIGNSVAVALAKPSSKGRGAASKANSNKAPVEVSLDDLSF